MSNLHAHMPMKAHAYKYHNELEEIMPQERAQKIYESTHQYHSFYTRLSLVHVGLRKLGKADVKGQIPCCHVLNQRRLTR